MVVWRFVFDDSVNGWRYCPLCGEEILEVYTGDYHGMISCMGDHENEIVEFEIAEMESEKLKSQN